MKKLLLIVCLVLTLSGCQETLFGHLSEQDANAVLAVLGEAKIAASKRHVKDEIWQVDVDKASFAEAVTVLRAAGVPSSPFAGLQETFKKQGLGSSPTEERARMMSAVSQELEKSIHVIDCVVNVRVHINIPAQDRFATTTPESSVSILVKHRSGCSTEALVEQVRTLAVNAVENTRAELVSVMTTPAVNAPVRVTEQQSVPWFILLICAVLLLSVAAGLGYFYRATLQRWMKSLSEKRRPETLGAGKKES
jgi:type III secretion protein J